MEALVEIAIYGVFYITGCVLIYVLSAGTLSPEEIDWKVRKKWSFLTIVHVVDGKKYLHWEWVILIGVLFWVFGGIWGLLSWLIKGVT